MSYNAGPSLCQAFFDQQYGNTRVDLGALTCSYVGAASGAVWGSNPPYALTDFLAVYPKFFGAATAFVGDTVGPALTQAVLKQNSNVLTVTSATGIVVGSTASVIGIPDGATVTEISGDTVTISAEATLSATLEVFFYPPSGNQILNIPAMPAGLAIGQLVTGANIQPGSVVTAIGTNSVTLSGFASASGTQGACSVYTAPFVPLVVLQLYLNLAQASIMQPRWLDAWTLGMALYIAHYATLWLQTEAGPNLTAQQVATSGLQQGILVSQSAGDVSASTQPVAGFDDWGSMGLTQYGVQLATLARTIGSGPIWVGSGY